jgi:hypothetical protein
MGWSMAQIAHQPGPVCVEGGVSRWLTGVVVMGGGAAPAPPPPLAAWGASSIRVPKKKTRGTHCSRGAGEAKPLHCHNPQALSNAKELVQLGRKSARSGILLGFVLTYSYGLC